LDTVNLYSGHLNIRIPLLKIGGRGETGYTMFLGVERSWKIMATGPGNFYSYFAHTNGFASSHWWADNGPPLYSPGRLVARQQQGGSQDCSGIMVSDGNLTRLTFISADGTELELVDQQTGGFPEGGNCNTNPYSRGTVFVARDGSGATFVGESPIYDNPYYQGASQANIPGLLTFRNGVRYHFLQTGLVDWIRDRNGNQINFYYDQYQQLYWIYDAINRSVSITHSVTCGSVTCDQISFQGALGAGRTIQVLYGNTSTALAPGYSIQTPLDLFGSYGGNGSPADYQVVTGVVIPNGRQYSFLYNSYSEPAQLTLPTGGKIKYTHGPGDGSTSVITPSGFPVAYRRVLTRDTYPDGVNQEQHVVYNAQYSVYTDPFPIHNLGQYYFTTTAVDRYDSAGNGVAHEQHKFYGSPRNPNGPGVFFPDYSFYLDGKEFETDELSANGLSTPRATFQQWEQRPCASGEACIAYGSARDTRVTQATTWLDSSILASQSYSYDRYNNKTDIYEYDFDTTLLRHTFLSYLTNGYESNVGTHLPSLLSEQIVCVTTSPCNSTNRVSDTQYFYDQTTPAPRSSLSGYTDPGTTQRGNLTTTSKWLSTDNTFINNQATYDIAGNVTSTTDGRGFTTTLAYDDSFSSTNQLNGYNSFAFVTSVTNPAGHVTSTKYDYFLGAPTDITDPNNTVTKIYYFDTLDRPTGTTRGFGSSAQTQVLYSYCDIGCNSLTTFSDRDTAGDGLIKNAVLYDGLGREIESQQFEDSGYISRKKSYDAMGRLAKISNSYRPNSTPPEPLKWTTYGYDGLGRQTSIVAADGLSATTTVYSNNQTTVTDPSGASTLTVTDAAGRATQVTEAATYSTSYSYDALDDLTGVNQNGRTRSFGYDSLRRLTSATNPEFGPQNVASGTVSYTYDKNGNVLTKALTGAPTVTMAYDALNRVSTKTYSDDTPPVSFTYDTVFKGALKTVANSNSSTNYDSYDALGRVTQTTQATSTNSPYVFHYGYNRAGALSSETFPSSRVLTFTYDKAGRPATLAAGSTIYATGVTYASHGPMSHVSLANNHFTENLGFSSDRQQLNSISVPGALSLAYFYCPNGSASCSTNNGNVLRQTIGSLTQDYGYGETQPNSSVIKLNRLSSAVESGGANEWFQNYSYDQYGNRWVGAGLLPSPSFTPAASSNFDSKNRLQIQNTTYDNSGNQMQIGGYASTYDAENRLTSSTISSAVTIYRYDGDGKRVMKFNGGTVTVYVYDAMGDLSAEYSTSPPTLPCQTCYLITDSLGSTRLVMNQSGAPVAYHDYLPFGEEIQSGLGGRSGSYGAVDQIAQKFTGQERDAETGLDFFAARYFSGAQGRFKSADEPFIDQNPGDPQSWNLFSYGRNNPLRYIDPTGRACIVEKDGTEHNDNSGGQPCSEAHESQKFTVRDNNLFIEYAGVTLLVGNGDFRPVSERSMRGETVNLFLNLSVLGDAFKLGMVLGPAAKKVLAEVVTARNAILAGSFGQTTLRGGFQLIRAGGAKQAVEDFNSLVGTGGSSVRNYGSVKATTLADGSEVILRQSTTKGYAGTPTLEFQDKVGNVVVKVRYQ